MGKEIVKMKENNLGNDSFDVLFELAHVLTDAVEEYRGFFF